MIRSRPPRASLRHFVSLVWAQEQVGVASRPAELVLPTGAMHLVISSACGLAPVGLIGGARDAAFRKEERADTRWSVGAMLRPDAAAGLLGAPGSAFAHQHTWLSDVWAEVDCAALADQLEKQTRLEERLAAFEAALEKRVTGAQRSDQMTAYILKRFSGGASVGDVVAEVGCSHRHLAGRFAEITGLKPKTYQRLRRFNRALDRLHREPSSALADIAAAAGYADQAHFGREFVAIAGLTPGAYRCARPAQARHVPMPG